MIGHYLEFLINVRGCSVNTAETYRSSLSCFAQFCRIRKQNPSWSSVDVDDIVSYVYYMRSRGLSARSVNVFLAASVSFFDYLCRFHGLAKNPAAMVDKVKEPMRLPKVIEQSVFDEFFSFFSNPSEMAYMKHSFYVSICLMYYAGLRASEVLTLSWINIKDRHMSIIGKGNKERIVPICNELQLVLDEWYDRQIGFIGEKPAFVICNEDGSAVSGSFFRRMVKNVLMSCGCPYKLAHPHALRHSFATKMAAMGLSLLSLQKILGHSSLNTTQVYVNLADSFTSSEFFNLTSI